jgi:hypothetical protein
MFKYSLMSAVVCFEGLWRYLDEESRVKDLELALEFGNQNGATNKYT